MKAIIPVAGSGTRLRPLTHSKPKALLYVGSKPIIVHIVSSLISLGCDSIILIISEDGTEIPACLNKYYPGMKIETIVQKDRLGLGHAVSLAQETVGNEEILIVYGDTIIDGDLSEISHCDVDGMIGVKEIENPVNFGVVNVSNGLITEFEEKPAHPRSNLAIVGFNYFKNPDYLFECIYEIIRRNQKTKGEYQITDAFQLMVENGKKIKPLKIDNWFDCGTPESLITTNRFMLLHEKRDIKISGSVIDAPVFVHESAEVIDSILGPNVSVGEHAIIKSSIIKESIIGSRAKVSNALLVNSLIGDDAEVFDQKKTLIIGDNASIHFYE